ncbi:monooxygenase FAD-binding protein [Fusarium phyllophilum]|uniref:Monooxygenase FAD-binding protein n=1 Tax=Fusarium phyllophilum TaxID=47803 RepID=A0A8H5IFT9_9HYPO|nr:monooxygenase FAD-binding protein [Fusarium phyllophilum]
MSVCKGDKRLKVAIIGGGPAGLGTAVELQKLPFVDWKLYEKRPRLSEIGGGFTLQPQTRRLLEHFGVADNINAEDYFQSPGGEIEQRRNGRTGELLVEKFNPEDVPLHHQSCRIARAKLQNALIRSIDHDNVHLSKRFVAMERVSNNQLQITFEDGTGDNVYLLVAADGIRSSIRQLCFPNHVLQYNGQSVYRTIISKTQASEIGGIPWAPVFWKHVSGLYVFTCPLGNDDFEVTVRIRRTQEEQQPVNCGRPFDLYEILRLAAKGDTQEFALFSGMNLKRITSGGNIALIGDASHALLGNFGSGAGFALEDVYALTRALEWAWSRDQKLDIALEIFDAIRSPHYERLHRLVDRFSTIKAELRQESLSLDLEIAERVKRISLASQSWMYYCAIERFVGEALCEADRDIGWEAMPSQSMGTADRGKGLVQTTDAAKS